jgi:3-isopropylmalate dehydrogenase
MLMLRHSPGLETEARAVERPVDYVLGQGLRTPDLAIGDGPAVSTGEMGDAVARPVRG